MNSNLLSCGNSHPVRHLVVHAGVILLTGLLTVGCQPTQSKPETPTSGIAATILATDPDALVGTIKEVDATMMLVAVGGVTKKVDNDAVFVILNADQSRQTMEPIAHGIVVNTVGSDVHLKYTPVMDAKGRKQRAPAPGDVAVRLSK